ncbi:hypothetical protein H4W30_000005 [Amycolatopsis roodepoortensis]|uniref:ATP-binding protein n=1 Tax=Amycolatopsis roodepoortensis TaxID=700274 RepID=A0ABR9KX77_9PSEU|nr:hypothetical protein [Amycolatopsis roodepoortensis]
MFQHPKFGKRAAEMAVRLIKRGRKYGVVLLLATQSPTKDSIPREITRNVACGVAFSVADQVANDGLLGSGKYAAGIRATDLRINTDRGTCVAVGITDEIFELVRTFYVPFEDGADDVTPVIARAMASIEDAGRAVETAERIEIEAAPVDHLADIAHVLGGEQRVRTQTVLTRLAEFNADEYEPWAFADLKAVLTDHGQRLRKVRGLMYVHADDVAAARRQARGEATGEAPETGGVLPLASPDQDPSVDQGEHPGGRRGNATTEDP